MDATIRHKCYPRPAVVVVSFEHDDGRPWVMRVSFIALPVHARRASATRIHSGSGSRATNAAARCCTSRRSNTHSIETREVQYRWHPWYGRSVSIYQVVARSGHIVVRCGDEQAGRPRRLELPRWMFDAATCLTLQMASTPIVDCEALLELKSLLAGAALERSGGAEQAGHLSLPCTEGAHAKVAAAAAGCSTRPAQALSSAVDGSGLAPVAAGDPPADCAASGKAAARASGPRRDARREGGER